MGSEMCIRDSPASAALSSRPALVDPASGRPFDPAADLFELAVVACLLYTSDAADERSSVDLGGRRIIKKKT